MNRAPPGEVFAGADGCPAGWVMVSAGRDGERLSLRAVRVVPDFAALLAATAECVAVAVDTPIGLAEDGNRQADRLARERLRPKRSSSVFPTPARLLLSARSYSEANALSWSALGKGLPAQAFGIIGKIKDADKCMTPQLQARIVESHPELCFWALAGDEPLAHSKHTEEGLEERLRLLESVYGPRVRELKPPRGAARDDVYDALVLAWTASHVAAGTAVHLPSEPQRDARGLRMEMVY